MKMLSYLEFSFVLILVAFLFTGCSSPQEHASYTLPDLSSVSGDLDAIGARVDSGLATAVIIDNQGATPHDTNTVKEVAILVEARGLLSKAKMDTDTAKTNLVIAQKNYNVTLDRLNYLEVKYAKAVGVLWKWRIMFFGCVAVIVVFILAKLKIFTLPFL